MLVSPTTPTARVGIKEAKMSSLENVKVGDKLVIEGRWRNENETVIKVTKLYVLTASYKFRKKDGCSVPCDRFISTHARPLTEEDALKLKRLDRR